MLACLADAKGILIVLMIVYDFLSYTYIILTTHTVCHSLSVVAIAMEGKKEWKGKL